MTGWKTFLAGLFVVILGYLQTVNWVELFNTPTKAGWSVVGIGIVFTALRFATNTSIFKSTSPAPMPPPENK